jgi:TolB-like protein
VVVDAVDVGKDEVQQLQRKCFKVTARHATATLLAASRDVAAVAGHTAAAAAAVVAVKNVSHGRHPLFCYYWLFYL